MKIAIIVFFCNVLHQSCRRDKLVYSRVPLQSFAEISLFTANVALQSCRRDKLVYSRWNYKGASLMKRRKPLAKASAHNEDEYVSIRVKNSLVRH